LSRGRRRDDLAHRAARVGQVDLRQDLCSDLGFSDDDRTENARRVSQVARLLAQEGTIAVVSLVSPFAADRDAARRLHADAGIAFVEVWMSAPPEECERRDPKGMWARARSGELRGFTGLDARYEPPPAPDLVLGPDVPPAEAAELVLGQLEHRLEGSGLV
jgi:bifunctional enzyme CysN/CysC